MWMVCRDEKTSQGLRFFYVEGEVKHEDSYDLFVRHDSTFSDEKC